MQTDHAIDTLWKILESRDRALSYSREQFHTLQVELTHTKAALQQAGDTLHQMQLTYHQDQSQTELFRTVAEERLVLINELSRVAEERLAVINELSQVAEERLAVINELSRVAEERLAVINELSQVAEERLAVIHQLQHQLQHTKQEAEKLQHRVEQLQQTTHNLRQKVGAFQNQIQQLEQKVTFLSTGKGGLESLQQAIVRKIGLNKNFDQEP